MGEVAEKRKGEKRERTRKSACEYGRGRRGESPTMKRESIQGREKRPSHRKKESYSGVGKENPENGGKGGSVATRRKKTQKIGAGKKTYRIRKREKATLY